MDSICTTFGRFSRICSQTLKGLATKKSLQHQHLPHLHEALIRIFC